jgi:hypothetical protein
MTRLKIYPNGGEATIWWKNFREYCRHHHKKMLYQHLKEWGCHFTSGAGDTLEFEKDADATAFLLRWS